MCYVLSCALCLPLSPRSNHPAHTHAFSHKFPRREFVDLLAPTEAFSLLRWQGVALIWLFGTIPCRAGPVLFGTGNLLATDAPRSDTAACTIDD